MADDPGDRPTADTEPPDSELPDTELPDTSRGDAPSSGARPAPRSMVPLTQRAGTRLGLRTPAGRRPDEPAPPRTPVRTVSVTHDEPDLAWAATSTLLADLAARLGLRRRPWTWVRALRAATTTSAVVVVLLLGTAWGATSWVEAAIRQIGALDPDSSSIVDADAQRGDQNYLVVGSDTRVGATPEEAVGDESGIPGARSDTVMVVHIPADRSTVTAVSFPRDLEIDRPACERWDPATGAYLGALAPPQPRVKLNTAYQVGGPRCVTKVVQALSGLAVNHFLGIDFQGFKGMVDAVGGVGICVEHPLRDAVLGDVVDRAGPTVLTGDQALGFVRARHVVGDPTSDYGRIQRQQRFLSALLREILSAGTLLDLGKLRGLVAAVSSSTFGENVGGDQLLALGRSMGGIDTHDVVFTTVPTTGVANARGNEVLRGAENRDLFLAVIDHRPLPGAPAAGGAPAPAAVAPQQVTLRLVDARRAATTLASGGLGGSRSSKGSSRSDGSGSSDSSSGDEQSGFRRSVAAAVPSGPSATSVASALRARGFRVVVADAADASAVATAGSSAGSSATVIRFSPDQQAAATTLAHAVPGAVLTPAPGAGLLDLVVGTGFDGRVVDPTVVAAPVVPTLTAADTACS